MVTLAARAASLYDDSAPLVGRAQEQEALGACLADALTGEGRLVLIGGEAGIGKTALALALARQARSHGALVLTGHAYDLTDTPPYGPWLELLAQAPTSSDLAALPTTFAAEASAGDLPAAPAGQWALFGAIHSVLAAVAVRQPLLLLLEDLHWADPASLDLLRYLARQLAGLPLLLVVTYRADELTRRHALFRQLPLLARESPALRLDLRRLDEQAVQALVCARYGLRREGEERLVTYLCTRTEGNPFFMVEMLRALEEEALLQCRDGTWELGDLRLVRVPPFLREVIEARLARLGETARDLLAVAAVIGQRVPFALWHEVAAVPDETLLAAVEGALEARALEEVADGSGVRFVHALIREALYEGQLAPRRQAWHRRVGEALAALPAPEPDTVAYHFRQAGDARALDWLLQAGERARRSYAWLTAAARFEAALALMPADGADAERRAPLLSYLAWLRRYADPQQAVRNLDDALQLATAAGHRCLVPPNLGLRGICRCYAGTIREGLEDMRRAVAAADALSSQERAQSLTYGTPQVAITTNCCGTYALWLALAGRYGEAQHMAEQQLAQHPGEGAQLLGDSVYGDAQQALGVVYAALGRPDDARRAFTLARSNFHEVEHHYQWATTSAWELQEVFLPYLADQPAERQQLATQAEQAWQRCTGAWADVQPSVARLPILLLGGQWAQAGEIAQEALAVCGIINQRFFAARALAPLALYRGETELAWEVIAALLPEGPETAPGDTWFSTALILQRVAAQLALATGDDARARAWLEAQDRWLAWSGPVLGRAESRLGWADYYRATGKRERAIAFGEEALAGATMPRQPLVLLAAHRLLGRLATAAGQQERARRHLAAALALADACAAPYERALTLLAQAELCIACRQRVEALSALDDAREICSRLGAAPALTMLAALEARLGNGPHIVTHPGGLSAREVEVLRLVAEGLTNVEVAATLVLSPRTVEQHLRSIYNKLGVSSRAAATRFAVEHHLS